MIFPKIFSFSHIGTFVFEFTTLSNSHKSDACMVSKVLKLISINSPRIKINSPSQQVSKIKDFVLNA